MVVSPYRARWRQGGQAGWEGNAREDFNLCSGFQSWGKATIRPRLGGRALAEPGVGASRDPAQARPCVPASP